MSSTDQIEKGFLVGGVKSKKSKKPTKSKKITKKPIKSKKITKKPTKSKKKRKESEIKKDEEFDISESFSVSEIEDDEELEGEFDYKGEEEIRKVGENYKKEFKVITPGYDDYEKHVHIEMKIVPKNNRMTSEIMTKYEYTEITSVRAAQLEKNPDVIFLDLKDMENITDPIRLAELEIEKKRCPLIIRRKIAEDIYEDWEVNEMSIPPPI